MIGEQVGRYDLERRLAEVLVHSGFDASIAGPVLRGEAAALADAPSLALIATDPPGVQRTIMASRKLVTRLGVSTAFVQWDRDLREGRAAVQVYAPVFAGGGQALLLCARDDAKAIRASLEQTFASRRLGRLLSVVRTCSPRELASGPPKANSLDTKALEGLGIQTAGHGFAGLVTQLHHQLAREKGTRRLGPEDAAPRCAQCGERGVPANSLQHGEERICEVCSSFQETGRPLLGREGIPQSIEEFDQLAWLYLDGTMVGKALRACSTLEQYATFSHALLGVFDWDRVRFDLTRAGVQQALPLVRGGDDVGLVFDATAGEGAFAAALRVLEGIERRARAAHLKIGAGAGLVVSNSLSARHAWDLAKTLVKRAKTRAPGELGFALDLEIVDGGEVLSDSLTELRPDRLQEVEEPPAGWVRKLLELSTRPWTLEEARRLHALYSRIDTEIPDAFNTLRRAEAALREDLFLGLSFARRALGRQRTQDGSQTLWTVLGGGEGMLRPEATEGLILLHEPAEDPQKRWRTAIPDLIDLERLHRNVIGGVNHG